MFKVSQRVGVEFKRSDAPRMTTSMRVAMQRLQLDALCVVYPGAHHYPMAKCVEAIPLWVVLQ